MKYLLIYFFISFNLIFLSGQVGNKKWQKHLLKAYVEVEAGALINLCGGANANLGYQFNPYLGLGVTRSNYFGFTDIEGFFQPKWSGWGVHWRGDFKDFVLRLSFSKVQKGLKGDDKLDCNAYDLNKEKDNYYRSFSIAYRWKQLLFGINTTVGNIDFFQVCENPFEINEISVRGLVFTPTFGVSFGGILNGNK